MMKVHVAADRKGNVRSWLEGRDNVRISLVRAFMDGLLGSPVPMLLVAKTLNSYSTQGLKSMTAADSCFPPSSSGTERHHRNDLLSPFVKMTCQLVAGALAHLLTTRRPRDGDKPTCGSSLPPEREGRPGLDGVADDGAVIVHPGTPEHRGGRLCHVTHLTVHRGARGSCRHNQSHFTRTTAAR